MRYGNQYEINNDFWTSAIVSRCNHKDKQLSDLTVHSHEGGNKKLPVTRVIGFAVIFGLLSDQTCLPLGLPLYTKPEFQRSALALIPESNVINMSIE